MVPKSTLDFAQLSKLVFLYVFHVYKVEIATQKFLRLSKYVQDSDGQIL